MFKTIQNPANKNSAAWWICSQRNYTEILLSEQKYRDELDEHDEIMHSSEKVVKRNHNKNKYIDRSQNTDSLDGWIDANCNSTSQRSFIQEKRRKLIPTIT